MIRDLLEGTCIRHHFFRKRDMFRFLCTLHFRFLLALGSLNLLCTVSHQSLDRIFRICQYYAIVYQSKTSQRRRKPVREVQQRQDKTSWQTFSEVNLLQTNQVWLVKQRKVLWLNKILKRWPKGAAQNGYGLMLKLLEITRLSRSNV